MMEKDRRAYKRDSYFCSDTKISLDGEVWHDAVVFDISAGGLKFRSNILFEIGEILWFDLAIPEFLSKKEMKVQGVICREGQECGKFVYGVEFRNLTPETQISIDENVMIRDRLRRKKKEISSD